MPLRERGGTFGSFAGRPQGLRDRLPRHAIACKQHGLPSKSWAGSLVLLALISLVSYAVIERPARAWLRALLAPRRAPVLGA
jgi:peptidoglycan/LPS O-acetylase OafA/YrhL